MRNCRRNTRRAFARRSVNSYKRLPRPPARTSATALPGNWKDRFSNISPPPWISCSKPTTSATNSTSQLITISTFLPVISVIRATLSASNTSGASAAWVECSERVSLVTLEVYAQGRPLGTGPRQAKRQLVSRRPAGFLPCLSLREPSTGST